MRITQIGRGVQLLPQYSRLQSPDFHAVQNPAARTSLRAAPAGFGSKSVSPAAVQPSLLLSHPLFLVSFPLPAPGRALLPSSSRVGPLRAGPGLGPAGPDAGRSPHGTPARPVGRT